MYISPTRIWTFDYQNRADSTEITPSFRNFPDPACGSLRRTGNALILGLEHIDSAITQQKSSRFYSWSHLYGKLPLGSNGTMDAVKVHRPRDWASRGDDFGRQAPQHFLYFLPLPQGQRSFRPDLGACNRIVFRLRARRYNRRNRAWRLAKTGSKSGRTSLSA